MPFVMDKKRDHCEDFSEMLHCYTSFSSTAQEVFAVVGIDQD